MFANNVVIVLHHKSVFLWCQKLTFRTNLAQDNRKIFRSVMSYRKYDSRMSQRYLNQNLIICLT